jgi:mannose/fructose/N-acetylgalactosamine-specific phosphotransferase system component IIC
MTETLASYLPVVLLGALVGLDMVSFPQAMICRPIVAATVAGALVGQPQSGLLIGAVLELIALEVLPVGASRYPEWGSASVVGGALFATRSGETGALPVACAAALLAALVSGVSMTVVRRLNMRLVKRRRLEIEAGSEQAVVGLQVTGLTLDLLRGGIVTFIALVLLDPATRIILETWTSNAAIARAVVVAIAASVAVSAIWRVFHSAAHARWLFFVGLAIGSILLVVRG